MCLRSQFPPIWHQRQAHSLRADILSGCAGTDDSYLQSYLSSWSSSCGAIPDTLPTGQPFWDRPGIQADRLLVESSLSSAFQRDCSIVKAQRGLALCPTRYVMWHEARRRSRESRNRTAAWTGAVCSTSVPLWSPNGRIRTPCICLQKGCRQINSAPRYKRAGSWCSLSSSNSQHEGTAGFM